MIQADCRALSPHAVCVAHALREARLGGRLWGAHSLGNAGGGFKKQGLGKCRRRAQCSQLFHRHTLSPHASRALLVRWQERWPSGLVGSRQAM